MEEIWKDVVGYEGIYQVSNLGRVKGLKRNRILNYADHHSGYKYCNLNKNNKSKANAIHRLVAFAFISNSDNKKEVNHIDGVKNNNNASNLEWCTRSENILHAIRIGIWDHDHRVKVDQYDLEGVYIKTFESIKDASAELKVPTIGIWKCLYNQRKTSKGYIWKLGQNN